MNTKYEKLMSLEPHRIRDTWVALGSSQITENTTMYLRDMIYKIVLQDESAELNGALVLCEESLSKTQDWTSALVENEPEGYFSFDNNITTPFFRLLTNKVDFDNIAEAIDVTYIPYQANEISEVEIIDSELEIILVEAGVPFIEIDELEFPRNKICDLMIKPALDEYFKYFPRIVPQVMMPESNTGQEFRIKLPKDAYGAVRAFINQHYGRSSGGGKTNPLYFFATEIAPYGGGGMSTGGTNRGRHSPGHANLQGFATMALNRAARQGIQNYAERVSFRIDRIGREKYLVGNSNKHGGIEVFWAMKSYNWDDIDYARLNEVRKLARANVLRNLGMLRGQVKSDIPGEVAHDKFTARADALENEVLEFWKSIPRTPVIR